MRSFRSALGLALAVLVLCPGGAYAQLGGEEEDSETDETTDVRKSAFKIGPRITYAADFEEYAFGGEVRYDLSENTRYPVQFTGSLESYVGLDNSTILAAGVGANYMVPVRGIASPYIGGGLGITRSSSEVGDFSNTTGRVDAVVGIEFETQFFRPFLQGFVSVTDDYTEYGVNAGVLFAL